MHSWTRRRPSPRPRAEGLDEEESGLGDSIRLANQEHGADDRAVLLEGDPAALARGVEGADEFRGDFGDQGFEALVPAVLLAVGTPWRWMTQPLSPGGANGGCRTARALW